jgi:succinoglycan biosynthesis protein ExoO
VCLEEAGFSAELIVIDDASRDGSQKLLRTVQMLYDEPRLKTLFLQQNLGQSRLRNLALQISQFRYICLMDADNALIPENLALFLKSIIETEATLVYGNLIDKQGETIVGLRSNEMATMRLSVGNYIDTFSVVDAKKLLRLGGYISHPQIQGLEDWEMILHLVAEEEKIIFVPTVMGYYHINPLSMNLEARTTDAEGTAALLQRMFAQGGTREWDTIQAGRIYHPAVGFIDEW